VLSCCHPIPTTAPVLILARAHRVACRQV
jgi:hypothetical protein